MSDEQRPTDPIPEASAEASAAPAEAPVAPAAPAETPAAPAPAAAAEEATAVLPADYWRDLPAAPEDDDTDSAQGDSASSTASLSSSVLRYRTINGRQYHSERGNAEYWASNDEVQNESLDIIHHVLTLCLEGKLHRAPLGDDVQKVLDVGTGTATSDFADEHPNCSVIGTEISPIQPSWVPPNLQFHIDDCTQEWTYAENSFDYVHIRWMFGSIKDWTALFQQAYKCLKPGGYLETHEPSVSFSSDDGTVHPGTAMGQFGIIFTEGGRKMGRSMTVLEDGIQRKAIEEAGFVDIEEDNFKTPIGGWPKDPRLNEIGQFQHLATARDMEGSMLYIAAMQGWSPEEVSVYVAHLRKEWRSKHIHGYYWQKIVWGRKPLAS
ncbi:S-adenosyl-L-methionine-dependent methyltransferase [Thozetella sp. PMI_491]|nr:S-adenosyl-L-methionine-dependent methyltransferase [Thozetella sp. PMI_491]